MFLLRDRKRSYFAGRNRSVFLWALLTLSLVVALPESAQAARLPDSSIFEALRDALQVPSGDERWRCAPRAEAPCSGVEIRMGERVLVIHELKRVADGLQGQGFEVSSDGELLIGDELNVQAEGDAVQVTARALRWSVADEERLTIENLFVDGTEVRIEGLAWRSAASEEDEPVVSEAEVAVYRGGEWEVTGLHSVGPGPLRLPLRRVEPGRSVAGFFPPTVHVGPDRAQVVGEYFLGRPPLSVRVLADRALVAGLGFALWTDSAFCEGACAVDAMSIDGFVGSQGFAGVHLQGATSVGDPRRHLSAAVDGLSWSTTSFDPRQSRELERGRFLRDWSAARVGASLSGLNHDLRIGAGVYGGDSRGWNLAGDGDEVGDIRLGYGTRLPVAAATVAEVRLEHRELLRREARRISEIDLRLDRLFGSVGRVFLRPSIRGALALGVGASEEGALAQSAGVMDLTLESGMSFRGRPNGIDHWLSPRIFVGRRILAAGEPPEGIYEDDPSRPGNGVTSDRWRGVFNFVGGGLYQRFRMRRFSLNLPVGAVVTDDGRGGELDFSGFLAAQVVGWGRTTLDFRLDCRGVCDDWAASAQVRIRWSDAWENLYGLSRGPSAVVVDHLVPSRDSPFRRSVDEPAFWGADEEAAFHRAGLSVQQNRWHARMEIYQDLQEVERLGATLAVGHEFPALGWGLALQLAALPYDGGWAATLGFRPSRAS